MPSYAKRVARGAPPQVFTAPDCQRVALSDKERLPVAAPAARVSGFPAGLLLFPALVGRRALGGARPGPGAPLPAAGGPVPATEPVRSRARCPIHQMQRAGRAGQGR